MKTSVHIRTYIFFTALLAAPSCYADNQAHAAQDGAALDALPLYQVAETCQQRDFDAHYTFGSTLSTATAPFIFNAVRALFTDEGKATPALERYLTTHGEMVNLITVIAMQQIALQMSNAADQGFDEIAAHIRKSLPSLLNTPLSAAQSAATSIDATQLYQQMRTIAAAMTKGAEVQIILDGHSSLFTDNAGPLYSILNSHFMDNQNNPTPALYAYVMDHKLDRLIALVVGQTLIWMLDDAIEDGDVQGPQEINPFLQKRLAGTSLQGLQLSRSDVLHIEQSWKHSH